MRKTLLLVVGLIIVLAGVVGYILGSAPENLTIKGLNEQAKGLADSSNQNTTGSDSNKTQTADLPTLESLLITAKTVPLPLSLRAGIFFDEKAANVSASQISNYGYPATVQKFLAEDQSLMNLVIMDPFENEANLQLAKYELFKQHGIVTQRIVTPSQAAAKAK
jgi:hypothetical protein